MKIVYLVTMALLACHTVAALPAKSVDCHDALALFEQPESTGLVFHCLVENEEVDIRKYPTREELVAKIKTEYANNANLHIVTEEKLIQDSLPEFEGQLGRPPPLRERYELFISESNCFARHFEGKSEVASLPAPVLEVVIVRQNRNQYLTTRIDHRAKNISQSMEETNIYDENYSVPIPADTLRLTWRLYGLHPLVQEQLKGKSIPSILCEAGKIQIANEQTVFQQVGTNKFVLQTLTEHEGLGTEKWQYDLEWNNQSRIHRLQTSLGQSIVESHYSYSSPDAFQAAAIPSQVIITATNEEKLTRFFMSDIHQIPTEKWDIHAVLNALMKKHSDYSRVEISAAMGRDSSHTASSTTANTAKMETMAPHEMQADSDPSTSTAQKERSLRKIACPRCHGDETIMPNCTLCGGRGTIWVQTEESPE